MYTMFVPSLGTETLLKIERIQSIHQLPEPATIKGYSNPRSHITDALSQNQVGFYSSRFFLGSHP